MKRYPIMLSIKASELYYIREGNKGPLTYDLLLRAKTPGGRFNGKVYLYVVREHSVEGIPKNRADDYKKYLGKVVGVAEIVEYSTYFFSQYLGIHFVGSYELTYMGLTRDDVYAVAGPRTCYGFHVRSFRPFMELREPTSFSSICSHRLKRAPAVWEYVKPIWR